MRNFERLLWEGNRANRTIRLKRETHVAGCRFFHRFGGNRLLGNGGRLHAVAARAAAGADVRAGLE